MALLPKHWLAIALSALFIAYILFQARFVILGPQVWIEWPGDGAVATTSLMNIAGRSRNIAWISLNGRQIFTDEKGFWQEKLILSPGVSIMTLRVRDRFGREKTESIQIVLP